MVDVIDVRGLPDEAIEAIQILADVYRKKQKKKLQIEKTNSDFKKNTEKNPGLKKLSFKRAREISKEFKGNLSDAVIEERECYL